MFLPTSIYHQTIAGDYVDMDIVNQWNESDMVLRPDYAAATASPWADDVTLQVIHNVEDLSGRPIEVAPRNVLKRVVGALREGGLAPGGGAGDGVLPDQAEPQPERADRAAGGADRAADGVAAGLFDERGRRVRQGDRRHLRVRRGAGVRDRHHHPGGRRRAGGDQPPARRPGGARRPGLLLQAHDPRGGAQEQLLRHLHGQADAGGAGVARCTSTSRWWTSKTGENIFTDDKGGADQGLLQLSRRAAEAHPDGGLHAGALREQLPPLRAERLGADQPRVGAGQPHHGPPGADLGAGTRGGSRTGWWGWTATPTSRSRRRSPAAISG